MKKYVRFHFGLLLFVLPFLSASRVAAHCDTLDGPVVEAAKLAILKSDVTPVLKWVSKDGEKEVREVFALTMKVRTTGGDAQTLADRYFFETLVRVHRAGEGEPFTGLKPSGTSDPVFLAADRALHDGTVDELAAGLAKSVQDGVQKRFAMVAEKRKHADDSIETGRAYVAAYIEYAHFVEAIHTISTNQSEEHHLHGSD